MVRKSNADRNNHEFCKRLMMLTEKRGISLLALSKETQIPKSTLHDWCTSSLPTDFKAAARLAKSLDVSLSYLLTGEEEQNDKAVEPAYERETVLIDGLAEIKIVSLVPKKSPS